MISHGTWGFYRIATPSKLYEFDPHTFGSILWWNLIPKEREFSIFGEDFTLLT